MANEITTRGLNGLFTVPNEKTPVASKPTNKAKRRKTTPETTGFDQKKLIPEVYQQFLDIELIKERKKKLYDTLESLESIKLNNYEELKVLVTTNIKIRRLLRDEVKKGENRDTEKIKLYYDLDDYLLDALKSNKETNVEIDKDIKAIKNDILTGNWVKELEYCNPIFPIFFITKGSEIDKNVVYSSANFDQYTYKDYMDREIKLIYKNWVNIDSNEEGNIMKNQIFERKCRRLRFFQLPLKFDKVDELVNSLKENKSHTFDEESKKELISKYQDVLIKIQQPSQSQPSIPSHQNNSEEQLTTTNYTEQLQEEIKEKLQGYYGQVNIDESLNIAKTELKERLQHQLHENLEEYLKEQLLLSDKYYINEAIQYTLTQVNEHFQQQELSENQLKQFLEEKLMSRINNIPNLSQSIIEVVKNLLESQQFQITMEQLAVQPQSLQKTIDLVTKVLVDDLIYKWLEQINNIENKAEEFNKLNEDELIESVLNTFYEVLRNSLPDITNPNFEKEAINTDEIVDKVLKNFIISSEIANKLKKDVPNDKVNDTIELYQIIYRNTLRCTLEVLSKEFEIKLNELINLTYLNRIEHELEDKIKQEFNDFQETFKENFKQELKEVFIKQQLIFNNTFSEIIINNFSQQTIYKDIISELQNYKGQKLEENNINKTTFNNFIEQFKLPKHFIDYQQFAIFYSSLESVNGIQSFKDLLSNEIILNNGVKNFEDLLKVLLFGKRINIDIKKQFKLDKIETQDEKKLLLEIKEVTYLQSRESIYYIIVINNY